MPTTIMYISGAIVLSVNQLTVVTSFDDIGFTKYELIKQGILLTFQTGQKNTL